MLCLKIIQDEVAKEIRLPIGRITDDPRFRAKLEVNLAATLGRIDEKRAEVESFRDLTL